MKTTCSTTGVQMTRTFIAFVPCQTRSSSTNPHIGESGVLVRGMMLSAQWKPLDALTD